MKNFGRPVGSTIDEPNAAAGETVTSERPTSEVTFFTALRDLRQIHFYLRPVTMMNFVKFDIAELSKLRAVTVISLHTISKYKSLESDELFLKAREH